MYTGWWLVGGIPTPLKNMTSPVGMITFPIYGKIKNVPNHQPDMIYGLYDLGFPIPKHAEKSNEQR